MYNQTMHNNNHIYKLKDGRRLGYCEYGHPKGKPLFFFHGFPGSRFSGEETHEAAKKIGIRVISTDRPGIGLSDYQHDRKLLDWPDDVVELADHLKIKTFCVLGISGGGPYSAVCAYKIPHRVSRAGIVVGLAPTKIKSNLEGLPLLNKFGWSYYHKSSLLRQIAVLGTALEFKYLPTVGYLIAFRNKEDRDIYKQLVHKRKGKIRSTVEAFRQGLKGPCLELKIYSDDWDFKLSDIKTGVYLWYGLKDKCVPVSMGKYYKSQIPNSRLFINKKAGHLARHNFEEKILKRLID